MRWSNHMQAYIKNSRTMMKSEAGGAPHNPLAAHRSNAHDGWQRAVVGEKTGGGVRGQRWAWCMSKETEKRM